jgi:Fic family protein
MTSDTLYSIEPLLPSEPVPAELSELAHAVVKASLACSGLAHPQVLAGIAPLLQAMNSYYTNKIEGQHTLPADIERALANDYDADPDLARRQRLALAHMRTEAWGKSAWTGRSWRELFSAQELGAIHQHLYAQISERDRTTAEGDVVIPGALRARSVRVGNHVAPDPDMLPGLIDRWALGYRAVPDGERALIALAAAHHRLTWIHPFRDGNGRAARLHSYLVLIAMGLTNGVWSPLRGLARHQADYYAHLAEADAPRRGDTDGRGSLSQAALGTWIKFWLEICLDQATFMRGILDLAQMKQRIEACVYFLAAQPDSGMRAEAATPLYHVFLTGEIERGEWKRMTGLAERTADRLLAACLKQGLLRSASSKGKVGFGVPLNALRFYFPRLWPEAEAAAERSN